MRGQKDSELSPSLDVVNPRVESSRAAHWLTRAAALAVATTLACGSDDAGEPSQGAPAGAGSGGVGGTQVAAGGASATGGAAMGGTSSPGERGGSGGNGGSAGRSAAGGSTSSGGSAGSSGGAVTTRGGTGGGSSGSAAGQAGMMGPPAPRPDGSSPYEQECHGDTVMCVDVNALRCLGIRDGDTVFGYSCSNACESDDDCSSAPASADAKAACVEFVTQKHCLLVCSDAGKTLSCPSGMGCYVYPGSPIGYCLWQ